jgi:hypothetical protein
MKYKNQVFIQSEGISENKSEWFVLVIEVCIKSKEYLSFPVHLTEFKF